MADKLTKDQAKAVEKAKGPLWKKVLWWCVGILGVIGTIVLLVWVFKRKKPSTAVKDVVAKAQAKVRAIDAEAKAKAAEAAGAEAAVVKEVKRIAEIDDEAQRARRMAELAAEDY
jgi:hypothetical protein